MTTLLFKVSRRSKDLQEVPSRGDGGYRRPPPPLIFVCLLPYYLLSRTFIYYSMRHSLVLLVLRVVMDSMVV